MRKVARQAAGRALGFAAGAALGALYMRARERAAAPRPLVVDVPRVPPSWIAAGRGQCLGDGAAHRGE